MNSPWIRGNLLAWLNHYFHERKLKVYIYSSEFHLPHCLTFLLVYLENLCLVGVFTVFPLSWSCAVNQQYNGVSTASDLYIEDIVLLLLPECGHHQFVDYSATFWMCMQKNIYIEFEFWSALHIYSEDKNMLEWYRIYPEGGPWRFQVSRWWRCCPVAHSSLWWF